MEKNHYEKFELTSYNVRFGLTYRAGAKIISLDIYGINPKIPLTEGYSYNQIVYRLFLSPSGDFLTDSFHDDTSNFENLVCEHCGNSPMPTDESGYSDGCLKNVGVIPGVYHLCCGHGNVDEAYVVFEDKTLNGIEAIEYLKSLRVEIKNYQSLGKMAKYKNRKPPVIDEVNHLMIDGELTEVEEKILKNFFDKYINIIKRTTDFQINIDCKQIDIDYNLSEYIPSSNHGIFQWNR